MMELRKTSTPGVQTSSVNSGSSNQGSGRVISLDLLRVAAVLLVLLHHARPSWMQSLPLPPMVAKALARGGWLGVDLFFVLSGYLVSGLLFREYRRFGNIRIGRFLVRRGLKIYPAFYVFLAISVLVSVETLGKVPERWWSEVFFLQSYYPGIWGHTWSLAIEEHFYISLPLILFVVFKFKSSSRAAVDWIPKGCIALCLAILTLRCANTLSAEFTPYSHFKPTHLRADGLIFGVLLSYLHNFRKEAFETFCRRYFYYMLAAGVWLWIPAFIGEMRSEAFIYSLGFTQFYIGAGLFLSAFVVRGVRMNGFVKSVAWIGTYSYSIYLWHLPLKVWGLDWLRNHKAVSLSPGVEFLIYLVGSVVIGILMAKLVEIPVLRLRDRYFPSSIRSPKQEALREYQLPGVEPALPASKRAAGSEPSRQPVKPTAPLVVFDKVGEGPLQAPSSTV